MRAEYKCTNCGTVNNAPDKPVAGARYFCHQCGSQLPETPREINDHSDIVGFMGGAMLGAAFGGTAGAIVGGVLGALIGKHSQSAG